MRLSKTPTTGEPVSVHLFGQPYESSDGTTIITVTRMRGRPAPVGIFVVRDGTATWTPAVDVTSIARFGEFIGLAAAVIGTLAVLRRPPWPDQIRRE
nr:hypothetical protein [Rhodococcus sp. (in: high G+C Gram-positive bacteria)]